MSIDLRIQESLREGRWGEALAQLARTGWRPSERPGWTLKGPLPGVARLKAMGFRPERLNRWSMIGRSVFQLDDGSLTVGPSPDGFSAYVGHVVAWSPGTSTGTVSLSLGGGDIEARL